MLVTSRYSGERAREFYGLARPPEIVPELIDAYIAMVKGVVERHYHDVTRYTSSTFLRMKLGEALARGDMAPQLYDSADAARSGLG